jgi:hypothetical protein
MRAPWLLACLAWSAPGAAVPPPPPPERELQGPATLCDTDFALILKADERALNYGPGWWVVVSGERESFGVRSGALGGRVRWRRVDIPGYGRAQRRRLFEWPGGRFRGWQYELPRPGREPVSVSADQFRGTKADFAVIGRVLIGEARARLC